MEEVPRCRSKIRSLSRERGTCQEGREVFRSSGEKVGECGVSEIKRNSLYQRGNIFASLKLFQIIQYKISFCQGLLIWRRGPSPSWITAPSTETFFSGGYLLPHPVERTNLIFKAYMLLFTSLQIITASKSLLSQEVNC